MSQFTFPALGGSGSRFQTRENLEAEVRRVVAQEASARGSADTAEQAARIAGDANLQTQVDALTTGVTIVGEWAPSSGAFPTTRPGGGAIEPGDGWVVTDSGTVDGEAFAVPDRLIALGSGGATFAGNWVRAAYSEQLGGPIGEANVTPAGGSVARPLADKLGEILSALDFMAPALQAKVLLRTTTISDASECTAAVQAAIQAVEAIGGVLFFPAGLYWFNGPLWVQGDSVTLAGVGAATEWRRSSDWSHATFGNNLLVVAKPNGSGSFTVEDGSVEGPDAINKVTVQGICIKSTAEMETAGALIYSLNPKDCTFQNLWLDNGFHGLHVRGCNNSFFEDVRVFGDTAVMTTTQSNTTVGVRLSYSRGSFGNTVGWFSRVWVSHSFPPNPAKGYHRAMSIEAADGVWLDSCYFRGAVQCLYIAPKIPAASSQSAANANFVGGVKIDNCWTDFGEGIVIDNENADNETLAGIVRNIAITNFTSYQYQGYGNNALRIITPHFRQLNMSDARINSCAKAAVRIDGGQDITLSNLIVKDCNQDGDAVRACVEVGVEVLTQGAVSGVAILGSRLGGRSTSATAGPTSHGILIGEGVENFRIQDNDLRGNSTRGLFAAPILANAGEIIIKDNIGHRTQNYGFVVFDVGETTKVIDHGLAVTPFPGDFSLNVGSIPTNGIGEIAVSNVTATQATLTLRAAPGSSLTVRWKVEASSV